MHLEMGFMSAERVGGWGCPQGAVDMVAGGYSHSVVFQAGKLFGAKMDVCIY